MGDGWVEGWVGVASSLCRLSHQLKVPCLGARATGTWLVGAPPGPLAGGGGDRESSERALEPNKLGRDPPGALKEV